MQSALYMAYDMTIDIPFFTRYWNGQYREPSRKIITDYKVKVSDEKGHYDLAQ